MSTPERERPSSLHEYLDPNPDHQGLWRNWYIVLVVIPLLYLSIFIFTKHSTKITKFVRPLPLKSLTTTRLNIRNNVQSNGFELVSEQHNRGNSSSMIQYISTNYMDVFPIKSGARSNLVTSAVASNIELPWCEIEDYLKINETSVTPKNITMIQTYLKQVQVGGYHVPVVCKPRHKVAIIVPFRNRDSNLAVFLYSIHPFLIVQQLEYRVFVIEQTGTDLFNKGSLLNIGVLEAEKKGQWNCFVFHDVDLLPADRRILYTCPTWPRHMCTTVGNQTFNSSYHTYFGGVSSMSPKHFKLVNGFSNMYWGWGGEDTDMFWRLRAVKLHVMRYRKEIAKYTSLPHAKSTDSPNRNKLIKSAMRRLHKDGLINLKYKVVYEKLKHLYTHIGVDLILDSKNVTSLY